MIEIETIDYEACEVELARTVAGMLLKGELELPILPEVATKLLRMCNDPDVDGPQIAALIRRDQTIASNLLRIANSAVYSSGTPIVSLQQAIARLGILKIREIVVMISCKNRVFDVKGYEDEVRVSFKQSLAAAAFSQEIARALRKNVEDAFLCGLLHDIGRPVLIQAFVDAERKGMVDFERDIMLSVVEKMQVNVGGELIEKWQLPSKIAAAVRDHIDPKSKNADANLLHFAVDMVRHLFDNDSENDDSLRQHPMIPILNLYPDQLSEILDKQDEILAWVESSL